MNNSQLISKLGSILDESKEKEGNYQIQTELVEQIKTLAADHDIDEEVEDYLNSFGIADGETIFDFYVEDIKNADSNMFSEITDAAYILDQFGQKTELMELYVAVSPYQVVTPVDYADISDLLDNFKDWIK